MNPMTPRQIAAEYARKQREPISRTVWTVVLALGRLGRSFGAPELRSASGMAPREAANVLRRMLSWGYVVRGGDGSRIFITPVGVEAAIAALGPEATSKGPLARGPLWDLASLTCREMAVALAPLLTAYGNPPVRVSWTPEQVLEQAMYRGLRDLEDRFRWK